MDYKSNKCSCESGHMETHGRLGEDSSNHRGIQEPGMEPSPSPWNSRGAHLDCRCLTCSNVGDYNSVVLRYLFVVNLSISPGKQNSNEIEFLITLGKKKSQQNLLVCQVRSLCCQSVRRSQKALPVTHSLPKLWWCHFPNNFPQLEPLFWAPNCTCKVSYGSSLASPAGSSNSKFPQMAALQFMLPWPWTTSVIKLVSPGIQNQLLNMPGYLLLMAKFKLLEIVTRGAFIPMKSAIPTNERLMFWSQWTSTENPQRFCSQTLSKCHISFHTLHASSA